MHKPLFNGACTAMVTPFLDGKINFPMMEILLKRQIEANIPAVVIAGTTGEGATLTDGEKIKLYRYSKEILGEKAIMIAGTGSNCTAHSIALSIAAENAGADAVLIVSPYYNKATPRGLIAHYTAISKAIHIPIILYNVPTRTGIDMPVDVYAELSKVSNIIGVKEASNNITKIEQIRNACGDTFSIWSGNDDQIVPVMALGGNGVISVLSNIVPAVTRNICTAMQAGDVSTAANLQCKLLPLIEALFCEVNPIPVKAAMKEIGYDCGGCRLPLCDITEENLAKLKKYL